MGNRKLDGVRKILAILLLLCFVLSIAVAPVSAADNSKNRDGYGSGYNKGYKDGKKQGKKDCEQHGSKDTLSKIPSPSGKSSLDKSYRDGYKKGYIEGYNKNRYNCLK